MYVCVSRRKWCRKAIVALLTPLFNPAGLSLGMETQPVLSALTRSSCPVWPVVFFTCREDITVGRWTPTLTSDT
ncbi:hypothetical protein LZ30DRAFT_707013 [Colletotrichum cereale]|nr:hypothetical protein LZ30DRAFT_707013 [Colletotrichum cereale]